MENLKLSFYCNNCIDFDYLLISEDWNNGLEMFAQNFDVI